MAITPEKARELNKEKNRQKIELLEKRIDEALIDRIKSSNLRDGVFIGLNDPDVCDLFEDIKERYAAAGWNVRYEDDQRDGDYLVFTPRKRDKYFGGRK